MSMLDEETIHKAIDTLWLASLSDVPTVFSNMDDTAQSLGTEAWIKQKVEFREVKQFELGNTDSSRNWGVLVFIIHYRRGTGTLDRDRLYRRVVNLFRSQLVGGATLLNVQPLISGGSQNWAMSGYQIPFYFNSI